ncbi:MAG: hypothetical protein KJO69_10305 [Gammaproteobacteria bacterium]|nr:hypothetical protein [Gammaproteobacteria bacterium]
MTDFANISHAVWAEAFESGMRSAGTFRAQSNMVIMGAVALFWTNSKNIHYLNNGLQYAQAYRGLKVEGIKRFFIHFTGAKFDNATNKFVKAGKKKAMPIEFGKLEHFDDWVKEKAPERKWDAVADEKAIIKALERKLDTARDALTTARGVEEVDEDSVNMILSHIGKTEALLDAARTLYN